MLHILYIAFIRIFALNAPNSWKLIQAILSVLIRIQLLFVSRCTFLPCCNAACYCDGSAHAVKSLRHCWAWRATFVSVDKRFHQHRCCTVHVLSTADAKMLFILIGCRDRLLGTVNHVSDTVWTPLWELGRTYNCFIVQCSWLVSWHHDNFRQSYWAYTNIQISKWWLIMQWRITY